MHKQQRVRLVRNPNFTRDGVKAYGHLLRKYDFIPTIEGPFVRAEELIEELGEHHHFRRWRNTPGHVHTQSKLLKRNDAGTTGDVTASDVQGDREYLAQSTGLPHAQLDSTSHNIYDPKKSSTSVNPQQSETWSITYGDGSNASGTVCNDTISLGGLSIKAQAIETATKLSDSFQSDSGDGLLGLAWPSLNTVKPQPVLTPVANMIAQNLVPKDSQLFTAYLTNSHDNVAPCYTFGYIDEGLLNGQPIHWAPVDNSTGFWTVACTSAQIAGTKVDSPNGTAVMDTGTSLALVDDTTCNAIYAAIPGAKQDQSVGGWIFPTSVSVAQQLPGVWLDIGGQMCKIHSEDIAYADMGNGMTYGGIQSRGSLQFNLLGDTVLKSMYAIFNQGNHTFGWVPRPDPSAPGTT